MVGYSLIIQKDKTKKVIPMKETINGKNVLKDKVRISTIDSGTIHFGNPDALIKYICKDKNMDTSNYRAYIEYQYKTTKTLPILYSNSTIKNFAKKGTIDIDPLDQDYIKFLFYFIEKCRTGTFYDYIMSSGCINDYLKSKIDEYIVNPESYHHNDNDSKFLYSKIAEIVKNYKILRQIIFYTEAFDYKENKLLTIDDIIESEMTKEEIREVNNDQPINEEMIDVFNTGNYEELNNIYDLDQLNKQTSSTLKKLRLRY